MNDIIKQRFAQAKAGYAIDHRYNILPSESHGFTCGKVADRQAIAVQIQSQWCVAYFLDSGVFLEFESIPLASFEDLRRTHLTESRVSVMRFSVPGCAIGITPFPDHLQRFFVSTDSYILSMYSKNGVMTQEQIESAMSDELDEVDQWLDDGMFVFYCNDEHWMDCDGNVVTS